MSHCEWAGCGCKHYSYLFNIKICGQIGQNTHWGYSTCIILKKEKKTKTALLGPSSAWAVRLAQTFHPITAPLEIQT